MLHILVGENESFASLKQRARRRDRLTWIVPKVATVGDDVIMFVRDQGFIARGRVVTTPTPTMLGRAQAYQAEIGFLKLLGRPVTLAAVAAAAPNWKWPTYPRSRASVPSSMTARLSRLFDRAPVKAVPGPDPSTDVPPAIEGIARETRVLVRGRSDRLRRAAIEKSRGVCAVCVVDFSKLLEGRGARILHVHHLSQLSHGSQPRATRVGDLAVVCPNCHGMLHLDPARTLTIAALRQQLGITGTTSASNKRMEPSRAGSRSRAAHS